MPNFKITFLENYLITWGDCSLYSFERSNMQNSNYSMSSIDKLYRSLCGD